MPRPISKGVVFQASANGCSASAQEARAVSMGLASSGIPIHLATSAPFDTADSNLLSATRDELEALTHRKVNAADCVLYYALPPDTWNLDYYGTSRVGRASFWTDRVPSAWVERCNVLDEIWVPSEFNRESFAASGVNTDKLRILPTGIDATHFRPGIAPFTIPERRKFNFLSITSAEDRKGIELLLAAYLREFQADDDVSLTLKVSPASKTPVHLAAELAFFIEKTQQIPLENAAHIILLEDNLPATLMPALYASANAFVLPTRGESSGRCMLEALACEVPVITTRWGAPIEFLNNENSYLIDVEGIAQVPAGDYLLPGHRWANPSVEHLRQLMRRVFRDSEEADARARVGRNKIINTYDWNVVLPQWEQHFQRLLS
jgi:glycosyltransferase involved in cell wall biosynthesis